MYFAFQMFRPRVWTSSQGRHAAGTYLSFTKPTIGTSSIPSFTIVLLKDQQQLTFAIEPMHVHPPDL